MLTSSCLNVFLFCVFYELSVSLAQSGCRPGWTPFDSSCYYVHYHDQFNWLESIAFCNTHHAHLVYVESRAENEFLKNMINNVTVFGSGDHRPNVWLGASDEIQEGHFIWYGIEEPMVYTDWYPGEPNSVPLNIIEDCVAFYSNWHLQWADLPCGDKAYFICEKSMEQVEIIG